MRLSSDLPQAHGIAFDEESLARGDCDSGAAYPVRSHGITDECAHVHGLEANRRDRDVHDDSLDRPTRRQREPHEHAKRVGLTPDKSAAVSATAASAATGLRTS